MMFTGKEKGSVAKVRLSSFHFGDSSSIFHDQKKIPSKEIARERQDEDKGFLDTDEVDFVLFVVRRFQRVNLGQIAFVGLGFCGEFFLESSL